MSERIRFHLDENTNPAIARALRQQSIDVTTTAEVAMLGQADEVQFAYICSQKRVIVTHDADFLRFASQTTEHPGVVFCQKEARSIGDIVRGLILLHDVYTPEEMCGRVEYL